MKVLNYKVIRKEVCSIVGVALKATVVCSVELDSINIIIDLNSNKINFITKGMM